MYLFFNPTSPEIFLDNISSLLMQPELLHQAQNLQK